MNMRGKVAIVTGAASGIGRSVGRLYAREGARVVVSDVSREAGERVVEEIRGQGGEATFLEADVARPDDCERLVASTLERYGRLDCACNYAGIAGEQHPTAEYSVAG